MIEHAAGHEFVCRLVTSNVNTVFQEGYDKGRECGYAEATREATSADEARSARDEAFAHGRVKGLQEGRGEGNHHFWELGRQSGLEEAAARDDGFKKAYKTSLWKCNLYICFALSTLVRRIAI